MSFSALFDAWGRWDQMNLAAPERLLWGWLPAAALAWGLLRWLWGQRLALPLTRGEGGAGLLRFAAPLPRLLRLAGLTLLWLALLRPQSFRDSSEASVQALDIVLALDVSGSMQANDLEPNRLEAAKATLKRFIDALPGDRIALVVFAGKAFTQCPLTLDHAVVKHFVDQMNIGTVQVDGTAVGDGLLMALSRLLNESGPQQRLIVLATDGRQNTGTDMLEAAKLAEATGVKIYTIGIGRRGGAVFTQKDPWGRTVQYRMEEPDEAALTAVAAATGGRYFRATDTEGLQSVYAQIAKAERREVKVKRRRDAEEHFFPFLWAGAVLLLGEALLRLRLRVTA
jgi:Ca-activated chloride channel family protein